jgi:hypothetical protein
VQAATYTWKDKEFDERNIFDFDRGEIVEFTIKEEFCHRYVH